LDVVFPNPVIRAAEECAVELKIASVDIETDVDDGRILATGLSIGSCYSKKTVDCDSSDINGSRDTDSTDLGSTKVDSLEASRSLVRVLCRDESPGDGIYFHSSEASLLASFLDDIKKADPDIITGWNFLDFDFPRLAERFAFHHIPFCMGRSAEESKFFPSSHDDSIPGKSFGRRSAAALVQGRQILDALRIYRSGGERRAPGALAAYNASGDLSAESRGDEIDSRSNTLEAAARSVLGEGKLSAATGAAKIAELKELYQKDPARFGAYCRKDAELALRILEKTGLLRLSIERASLTGVSLDKAWTSVASFERIYGMELYRRKIASPFFDPGLNVSGAAGGTVLEPLPGLFPNVAVFDFRSLYPTIMQTFNIDPLSHARAGTAESEIIVAPNGAAFSREKGILPGLIAGYFAARRRALEAGDEEASFVYKILMNSFYGVLGTPSCRYGRTELAGAITSFAKKWLWFSRDWFAKKGYRVLYGDTDSLFIQTGLGDESTFDVFIEWGKNCTRELNEDLKNIVKKEYGLVSCMELRFDKLYRRFIIPPLRNQTADERGTQNISRGRAKGYGGHLLHPDGSVSIDVKGMEAVRSDYTPLARRIQIELLDLVFKGCGEPEFKEYVDEILRQLRTGKLDCELVYRKRLARAPETYTSNTPPQVKAARALGWKDRKGSIAYVWTLNGPEPLPEKNDGGQYLGSLDYDHYAGSQVLPTARSIAAAIGWKENLFPSPGKDFFRDGQMELGL
jgi:DNA polymerase-2